MQTWQTAFDEWWRQWPGSRFQSMYNALRARCTVPQSEDEEVVLDDAIVWELEQVVVPALDTAQGARRGPNEPPMHSPAEFSTWFVTVREPLLRRAALNLPRSGS